MLHEHELEPTAQLLFLGQLVGHAAAAKPAARARVARTREITVRAISTSKCESVEVQYQGGRSNSDIVAQTEKAGVADSRVRCT